MIKSDFELQIERDQLIRSKVSVCGCSNRSNKSVLSTFGNVLALCESEGLIQGFKQFKGYKNSNDPEKVELYKRAKHDNLPFFILTSYDENGGGTKLMKDIKNPYIIIDIDNIEVSDENLDKLNSIPWVLGTGVSVSGFGYWQVLKFDSRKVKSEVEYKAMFQEIQEHYEDYGLEIDSSCSNINRARYCSPYQFFWSDNYKEPYEPSLYMLDRKIKRPIQYEVINQGSNKIKFGAIREPYRKGQMYEIRWRWANTIYSYFGEEGFGLYMDILKEDPDDKGKAAIWKTAQSSNKEPSKRQVEILRAAGLIEDDSEVEEIEF